MLITISQVHVVCIDEWKLSKLFWAWEKIIATTNENRENFVVETGKYLCSEKRTYRGKTFHILLCTLAKGKPPRKYLI